MQTLQMEDDCASVKCGLRTPHTMLPEHPDDLLFSEPCSVYLSVLAGTGLQFRV